jgi:hypothetical protein
MLSAISNCHNARQIDRLLAVPFASGSSQARNDIQYGERGALTGDTGVCKVMSEPATSGRVSAIFQGLIWAAFPLVFVAFGVGMVVMSAYQAATYLPITAIVERVKGGDDASDSVSVDYSYSVDGRRYTGAESADEDSKSRFNELRQYKAGEKLTVYYNPRDPGRSQYSVKAEAGGLVFVIFIMPFLSIGLNRLWFGLTGRELLRSRRPNSESVAVPGGGLFWVFTAMCVVGTVGQVVCSINLNWPWSLVSGLVILFLVIPAAMFWAARLRERWRAAKSAKLRELHATVDTDAAGSTQHAGELDAERLLSKRPRFRTTFAVLLGFTVFWCSLTSVFTYFAVGSLVKHSYARWHFAAAQGVVIASRVKVTHDSESGSMAAPRIKYRYSVDGKEYVGERYDFAGGSSSDDSYAQRAVSENPPGKHVTVYYDPAKPSMAILHLAAPGISYFLLLFLQPFILVGLGMPIVCVYLPFAHTRTKRFLQSDATPPWSIPGWGVLEQDFDGLVLRSRRNLFAPFGYAVAAYGVACFLAIFIVGFFFHGFGDTNVDAVRWAFIVAACVGVVVLFGGFLFVGGRNRVVIDTTGKRLVVHNRGDDLEAPLANITGLRLCKVRYRAGMEVGGSNVRRLLLEAAIRDAQPIPLHAFRWQSSNEDDIIALARKAQQELARIIGCPVVKTIGDIGDD